APCGLPTTATCWPPERSCSPAADAICSGTRGSWRPISVSNPSSRRSPVPRRTTRVDYVPRPGLFPTRGLLGLGGDGGLTVDLGLAGRRAAIGASSGGLGFATAAALAAEG